MLHRVLDYPEGYLSVRKEDGTGTIIGHDRLIELADGATPNDDTEQALVAHPDWLRIYLRHVIGDYPLTIPAGGPLPEWEAGWLESVE